MENVDPAERLVNWKLFFFLQRQKDSFKILTLILAPSLQYNNIFGAVQVGDLEFDGIEPFNN